MTTKPTPILRIINDLRKTHIWISPNLPTAWEILRNSRLSAAREKDQKRWNISKRLHRNRRKRLTLGAAVDKHHAIADKVLRVELARSIVGKWNEILIAYLGDVGELLECVRHFVCNVDFLIKR